MTETGYAKANYMIPEKEFPYSKVKPNVKLFGTGGTIASRLDYRTGAVIPAFSPGELYGAVPELADVCNINTEKLFAVFSENMGPSQYITLAKAIGKEIANRDRRNYDWAWHRHPASHCSSSFLHGTGFTHPDNTCWFSTLF